MIRLALRSAKSLSHVISNYRGNDGIKGGSNRCNGKNADDTIVVVPLGTIFMKRDSLNSSPDKQTFIIELEKEGDMFVAARGGSGGKGNAFFTDSINQTPMIYEKGAKGENQIYLIEMKTIAHFGLIGYPNAGKSTLLNAVSRANPKIAPYPFTTLHAQLGVMMYRDGVQLRMADLPGLIQGSHLNHGLGYRFLRHAQRCILLLYVIDFSTPLQDLDDENLTSIDDLEDRVLETEAGNNVNDTTANDSRDSDINAEVYDSPVSESPWIQFEILKNEVELYLSEPDNLIMMANLSATAVSLSPHGSVISRQNNVLTTTTTNEINPLELFYDTFFKKDSRLCENSEEENASSTFTVAHSNRVQTQFLPIPPKEVELNHQHRGSSSPKYKYIVLGTKFDKSMAARQNLLIFKRKYPDLQVFPISAQSGYNVRELMTELRKLYDIFQGGFNVTAETRQSLVT